MSVWFGPKVALSELSCSFGPGVTGLLGPNGAGKTTLMRAMTGLDRGQPGHACASTAATRAATGSVHARMALVPEDEAVPAGLTARQFVRYVADLHGVADRGAPDAALATVGHARRRRPARRRLQQGHAPAHQGRRRARDAIRRCSCSTSR